MRMKSRATVVLVGMLLRGASIAAAQPAPTEPVADKPATDERPAENPTADNPVADKPAEVAPVDKPAPAKAAPGLTLAQGAIGLTLVAETNASSGKFGQPTSIAPDLAYGVTPDLTLSIVHSTFGLTGFRGSAGRGICVTGTSHGCAHVYDGGGVEALYGLHRGPLAVAALVGAHALSIDATRYGLKLGFKIRYTVDRLVLGAMPAVFVAITERNAMAPNRDILWLPASIGYKLTPEFALGVGGGLKGPIEDLGKAYEIALGVNATYAVTPKSTVGLSWAHGKILGGTTAVPPGTSGFDFRAIHLWLATSW